MLARRHKVRTNPPVGGKRSQRGHSRLTPQNLSHQPNVWGSTLTKLCITVYRSSLLWTACREEISVITTFLKACVPFNKLNTFRALLEQNGTCLARRRSLSDLIPFVHQQEVQKISKEIEGKKVLLIFDGTTRMGEAMVILVCFVSDDCIEQQLICVQLLAKSLCGEEMARELVSVLQVNYKVSASALISAMHDRTSVNTATMRTIKVIYPQVLDSGCFPTWLLMWARSILLLSLMSLFLHGYCCSHIALNLDLFCKVE